MQRKRTFYRIIRNFAGFSTMRKSLFILLSLAIALSSCSEYEQLLKSDDFSNKYVMAKQYYGEGNYAKALPLLDQLLTVKMGTSDEEEIRYYIAYCYYGQSQYLIAATLFKNFFISFPRSYRAEECLFQNAYSLYKASPPYNLDQTQTYKALSECQYFVDTYKNSERVAEANAIMDELRLKLETKEYESANLYFATENYQAAAVTLENLLKDFPETTRAEEFSLQIARAYFNYASQSVPCKMPERFEKAISSCDAFAAAYPNSISLPVIVALKERSIVQKEKAIIDKANYDCNE